MSLDCSSFMESNLFQTSLRSNDSSDIRWNVESEWQLEQIILVFLMHLNQDLFTLFK
jgi:hypothetical protein